MKPVATGAARARAPYGREAKYSPPAAGATPLATYYGQPQLKKSHWGLRVALYIFIAGLSGAAQVIAAAADLTGGARHRGTVARGRHIALVGVVLGPPLLIWDLHTPQRFYNMLRIFRRTSPMSIGTYVLSGFGLSSLITAAAEAAGWSTAARIAQLPAALTGAGMTTYTAALLSATSTPLWAAAPCELAVQFAASSLASGAALLRIAARVDGDTASDPALDSVAFAAAATELAAGLVAQRRYQASGVAAAVHSNRPWALLYRLVAIGIGSAFPVAAHAGKLIGKRSRPRLGMAVAAAIVAGSFVLRWAILGAGNDQALRPGESLRFARGGADR